MRQSVSLITLGVADYERAKAFYGALGWSTALEVQETAFFAANGVVLTLWSRDKLAADTGILDDGAGWSGITLAHNVSSNEEVNELIYGGYAGASASVCPGDLASSRARIVETPISATITSSAAMHQAPRRTGRGSRSRGI